MATSPMFADQLLYHTIQLSNVIYTGLSTFISLNALCRDMMDSGLPCNHYIAEHSRTAHMLYAFVCTLGNARCELQKKPAHMAYQQHNYYLDLMRGIDKMTQTVARIPADTMVTEGLIENIRHNDWPVIERLRNGNRDQGTNGWGECWRQITHSSATNNG